jgi:uncharacterized protein YjeT (DUF2065 family)
MIGIAVTLLVFLGLTFAVAPRVGMNVFGLYSEKKTTPEELKIARIAGGVAAAIGLVIYFLM